ncbi:MAG TPA: hypothetical protein VFI22_04130 [Thermomicrobiales bacterium]|nr:hypothetical protein [Thermomicrobiales bacterium]
MGVAYDIASWQLFFATLAGATAALTGLLFVALSLHLQQIISRPATRGQAREALGGFLSLLAISIAALIPGQGSRLLAIELLLIGLAVVAASIRLQGDTLRRLPPARRGRRFVHLAPVNLGTATVLIAGVSLFAERGGGLYWLAPTVMLYLGNALFNAWSLTVQIGEE